MADLEKIEIDYKKKMLLHFLNKLILILSQKLHWYFFFFQTLLSTFDFKLHCQVQRKELSKNIGFAEEIEIDLHF
jgi:hypothetical protein